MYRKNHLRSFICPIRAISNISTRIHPVNIGFPRYNANSNESFKILNAIDRIEWNQTRATRYLGWND